MKFTSLSSLVILSLGLSSFAQAQHRDSQEHGRDGHRDRGRDHAPPPHVESPETRFGHNEYRDNHNHFDHSGKPPIFAPIPRHWDAPRPGVSLNLSFRSGYYGYGLDWRDSSFRYRFYVFDYPKVNPAFSPWYYYPQLPGYVDAGKVSFNPAPLRTDVGRREAYDSRTDHLDKDLSNAILDLTDAVEKGDTKLSGQLVPRGYNVVVDPPTGRSYRMNSDDFYGLFSDMTAITRTRTFEVTEVQEGRDWAQVYARHDFDDPWGRSTTEYVRVTLEYAKNGFRIAELATSRRSL